jgi:hypothetical protein
MTKKNNFCKIKTRLVFKNILVMSNEGTVLCKYFITNNCTNNNCKFSHSHEKYKEYKRQCSENKDTLCRFFLENSCTNGILCTYSHSEELKKTLESEKIDKDPIKTFENLVIKYKYKKIIHDGYCSDVDEDTHVKHEENTVTYISKVPHYIKSKKDLIDKRYGLLKDLCLYRIEQGSGSCGLECGFHYDNVTFDFEL